MKKKFLFPLIAILVSLAILAGALISQPRQTHAAAPKVRISLTSGQCTPVGNDSSGQLVNEQTCIITISTNQTFSGSIDFSASYSAYSCAYNNCGVSKTYTGVAIVPVQGTTLHSNSGVTMLLIVPYY